MEGRELKEANELIWESCLELGMRAARKTVADVSRDKKSAASKVWIVSEQKLGGNRWRKGLLRQRKHLLSIAFSKTTNQIFSHAQRAHYFRMHRSPR